MEGEKIKFGIIIQSFISTEEQKQHGVKMVLVLIVIPGQVVPAISLHSLFQSKTCWL